MKRFLILLLILALCLTGCGKKKVPTDLPGGESVPEGVDWKVWDTYTPATLILGEEAVDVLMALDEIHLAIYYDREEQELFGSITILNPLSDLDYSREHLRVQDKNEDGYDDICIADMLDNGDRVVEWWLWDPEEKQYVHAPEETMLQHNISSDITWMTGKEFDTGTMETPTGPQDLLITVEGETIFVYLDSREEQLLGTAKLPAPLSREALDYLQIYSYWDCPDVNGDGWGDLQLPYRWEETADGSLFVYNYVWLWEEDGFVLDRGRSNAPAA